MGRSGSGLGRVRHVACHVSATCAHVLATYAHVDADVDNVPYVGVEPGTLWYSFTWALSSATKMSKLDRFLVTDGLLSSFPHLSAVCLDRHLLDHRPILLRETLVDFGATPFLEGDENSQFFHEIINRKRANLSVKDFDDPGFSCGKLNFTFPNRLSMEQAADLEIMVSNDEIRKAVWGCGENKSPGPDGFTFEFFRKFWTTIGPDFCSAVQWFFEHGYFAAGCNSSFVTLIPKILEPKLVSDFRPISLIGSIYKVVTKILASRLSNVISDLISNVQTAFLPNRQILDGPFIVNEILSRCKIKNQKAMIFKVDFAKAYDSIRWDYLDDVLNAFGFGCKWRSWILA
nr:RNA-directed DNA polymerase, eukaryota, reverse transcriptase zinc-binding domain protein [Tanacetum cinerariifolium]